MKKAVLVTGLGVLIVASCLFFFLKSDVTPEEANARSVQEKSVSPLQVAKVSDAKSELPVKKEMSEKEVIDILHRMTHQKVLADQKRGAIQMTPYNIEKMTDIVSQSDYDMKQEMLTILQKWESGDFSKADDDHNYFWGLLNGTIGRAYGIMTAEQERKFVQNNFQ